MKDACIIGQSCLAAAVTNGDKKIIVSLLVSLTSFCTCLELVLLEHIQTQEIKPNPVAVVHVLLKIRVHRMLLGVQLGP